MIESDSSASSTAVARGGAQARERQFVLIGGGIASLACAVFLIRDGGVSGGDIRLLEQSDVLGGSLDGAGAPESGYLVRGGRMFEPHFACTFDLLSTIPSLEHPGRSAKDEIDAFNREVKNASRCRLVSGGRKVDTASFGLGLRDRLGLAVLTLRSEASLGARTIADCFAPAFFSSNFWFMWATAFAFQPWHGAVELRRYMLRFMHLFPGFKRLEGILRTRYNQYDSLIRPIQAWLSAQGVRFETGCRVVNLDLASSGGGRFVAAVHYVEAGERKRIEVAETDRVFVTLGSMTEGSYEGSMTSPPEPAREEHGGAWPLWQALAARNTGFGRPDAFCGQTDHTTFESFTVTLRNPAFFTHMERFTGNVAGTGGLVTFIDSNWLVSIVMLGQPHFKSQPGDIFVFWGYGLRPDRVGNHIPKKMTDCTGEEILQELLSLLEIEDEAPSFFAGARCIPCVMPFITSQFMPRTRGDRPAVIPEGARNFAFVGQFCELPDDTVFTVEYSVRSAMTAVQGLLGLNRPVPPVYQGRRDPRVLLDAIITLND